MEIYLIRHTSVNVDSHLCYGHLDVPVAESFEKEAKLVANIIEPSEDMQIISSPSTRCIKLAEYLSPGKYRVDNRFRELFFGDWEGLSWNEIDKLPAFHEWAKNFTNGTPPNGESYLHLQDRAMQAINELHHEEKNSRIIIITHGGVIRAILAKFTGEPLEKSFNWRIDFHSVTKIRFMELTKPEIIFQNRL